MLARKAFIALVAAIGLFAVNARAEDSSISLMTFAGSDGSYTRAMKDGITFGLSNDPPYGYIDQKTQQPDGIDVRMFKALTELLGIKNGRAISGSTRRNIRPPNSPQPK